MNVNECKGRRRSFLGATPTIGSLSLGAAAQFELLLSVTKPVIPLLCLLVRVMGNDVWPALELRHPSGWLLCVLGWLVLMALKVLTGIVALGITREIALDGGPEDQAGRPFIMPGIGRYTLFGKSIM